MATRIKHRVELAGIDLGKLYSRGQLLQVLVDLKGTEPGRVQSVRLYRGKSCEEFDTGGPAYFLTDLRNGTSNSTVKAPEEKLLSGNYNLVVFSSNAKGTHATACGHLYT